MSDCFFCGAFVGEENGDGGCRGRTIGNRDICEQCLGELKYVLELINPKSPSERENNLSEELNETESNENEFEEGSGDPFSSSPKI